MGVRGRQHAPGTTMAVALRGLARDVTGTSRIWENASRQRGTAAGWEALAEALSRAAETAARLAAVAEDRAGILRDDAERAERTIMPSADGDGPSRAA